MHARNELQVSDTLISSIYLALAGCGAIGTWTYNILWMQEVDRAITLKEFVLVGFQGPALLGSLASDFWIGALASFIFMIVEGRRLRMRQLWICVMITFVVAWACGLPLFMYLRQRALCACLDRTPVERRQAQLAQR